MDPTNSTLNLTFSASNYQKGDQYTITIPKGDFWSNANPSEPAVVAAPVPGANVNVARQANGSYVITDKFTSNGAGAGLAQTITIAMQPVDHFTEFGNIAKTIIVRKNGHDDTSLTIYENIDPRIITSKVTRESPSQQAYARVRVHQKVFYGLDVTNSYLGTSEDQSLSNQQFGTFKLTLNVPAHFLADTAMMKSYLTSQGLACQSITKSAAGAPIVFTGISITTPLKTVEIIGQYEQDASAVDTPVNAEASQLTFTFNDGHQQVVTIPAWSDILLGNEQSVPEGQIFEGQVDNEYPKGDSVNGIQPNTVPLRSQGRLNSLTVTNMTDRYIANATYTANFSAGYSLNQVTLTTSNQAVGASSLPALTVTYADGTTATVNGNGGVYQLTGKQVKSIQWSGALASGANYILTVNGQPASDCTINQKLTASISSTYYGTTTQLNQNAQTLVGEATGIYDFDIMDNQVNHYRTVADPNQMANDNGKTWDGSFTLENSAEHAYPLKNPRIYLVVPSTVNPQSLLSPYNLDPQGSMFGALEWPAKAKLYQAGGKYVIEFDG